MKKGKLKNLAVTFVYFLPVICFFISEGFPNHTISDVCLYCILVFGWVSPAIYMKQEMQDIEHPAVASAVIHFATIILGCKIFDWPNSSDPLGKIAWALIVVFSFAALGYHSKRHEEYKAKYQQELEENKRLKEEAKNGHNT
ncbi:MAG: hypothetical protein Q4A83_07480 [Bacillota bacterium]|nr:hypothetical protein [Bacillota bacterium]